MYMDILNYSFHYYTLACIDFFKTIIIMQLPIYLGVY